MRILTPIHREVKQRGGNSKVFLNCLKSIKFSATVNAKETTPFPGSFSANGATLRLYATIPSSIVTWFHFDIRLISAAIVKERKPEQDMARDRVSPRVYTDPSLPCRRGIATFLQRTASLPVIER
jgi:hypothetical protein